MDKRIERLVHYYMSICNTSDPFKIAKRLGIEVYWSPLGNISGYYKYVKHHKCVYINSDIDDEMFLRIIMAHELGHALLHWKENCSFLENKTLLSTRRFEIQANKFAAILLITDELIAEFSGYSAEQFSNGTGIPIELIYLRLK